MKEFWNLDKNLQLRLGIVFFRCLLIWHRFFFNDHLL